MFPFDRCYVEKYEDGFAIRDNKVPQFFVFESSGTFVLNSVPTTTDDLEHALEVAEEYNHFLTHGPYRNT
jgi:hypothetical protein